MELARLGGWLAGVPNSIPTRAMSILTGHRRPPLETSKSLIIISRHLDYFCRCRYIRLVLMVNVHAAASTGSLAVLHGSGGVCESPQMSLGTIACPS